MAEVAQEQEPFITMPDTWTAEQAEEFRQAWDAAVADGSIARRHVRWLPPGPAFVRDMTPYFSIIIEWGRRRDDMRPLPGWDTAIYDTASGDLLPGVSRLRLVDVDAEDVLKAELTMFADEDGNPSAEPHLRDGDVITAVFRVNVSEMRVREPIPPEPGAGGVTLEPRAHNYPAGGILSVGSEPVTP